MTSSPSRPSPSSPELPVDPWTGIAGRARTLRQELHSLYLDALSVAELGPASNPSRIARSTMKQRITSGISDAASDLANIERIARNESGRITNRAGR